MPKVFDSGVYRDALDDEIIYRPLAEIQAEKLSEISAACNQQIENGLTITLSDGSERTFSYDLKDQSNITMMMSMVNMGAEGYIYPEDDGSCSWYSAKDIAIIYAALGRNKTATQTYHNILKRYILGLTDPQEVLSVQWGQPLTGQWLEEYTYKMGLLTPIIESMGGGGNAGG